MRIPLPAYTEARSEHQLSEREREILRLVVKSFVNTADPVGSRFLARKYPIGLSPASIRNTLSGLEDLGYLDHPHTSAGRIPTELGYRKFVNELMETAALSQAEKNVLKRELERLMGDPEDLLRESSRVLGRLSNLLGVALLPRLSTGVLDRLEIVPLSVSRAMFVISMHGGLVKTIVVELDVAMSREEIDRVVPILNERLSGLTLEEIRRTHEPRLRDIEADQSGIVRLVLNEAPALFSEPAEGKRLRHSGAQNILLQPEFQEPSYLRDLIGLIDDENMVVQLLEDGRIYGAEGTGHAVISIGSENTGERTEKYSVVTARYKIGDSTGTIGVLGPMRMDYARAVALVEGMAALLGRTQDKGEK